MNVQEIINQLKKWASPRNVAGMARFGINVKNTLGVSIPKIRGLAKKIGQNHTLAQKLWQSEIHEARILASMIDKPSLVNSKQMEQWVQDFDSWDVCDQVCMNLFVFVKPAYQKCFFWCNNQEEFVKRAAFTLMACCAVKNKDLADRELLKFLPIIERAAADERNYVRKAVNWALRQIGKRNLKLNKAAIKTAEKIQTASRRATNPPVNSWIANDALRELRSPAVQRRLKNKK